MADPIFSPQTNKWHDPETGAVVPAPAQGFEGSTRQEQTVVGPSSTSTSSSGSTDTTTPKFTPEAESALKQLVATQGASGEAEKDKALADTELKERLANDESNYRTASAGKLNAELVKNQEKIDKEEKIFNRYSPCLYRRFGY